MRKLFLVHGCLGRSRGCCGQRKTVPDSHVRQATKIESLVPVSLKKQMFTQGFQQSRTAHGDLCQDCRGSNPLLRSSIPSTLKPLHLLDHKSRQVALCALCLKAGSWVLALVSCLFQGSPH